jgi:hypothetical protein
VTCANKPLPAFGRCGPRPRPRWAGKHAMYMPHRPSRAGRNLRKGNLWTPPAAWAPRRPGLAVGDAQPRRTSVRAVEGFDDGMRIWALDCHLAIIALRPRAEPALEIEKTVGRSLSTEFGNHRHGACLSEMSRTQLESFRSS